MATETTTARTANGVGPEKVKSATTATMARPERRRTAKSPPRRAAHPLSLAASSCSFIRVRSLPASAGRARAGSAAGGGAPSSSSYLLDLDLFSGQDLVDLLDEPVRQL